MKFPKLIDGGLSNVLEGFGCDLNHKLWSAKLLESNPEALIETHLAYLNAGAQCIATASYQASFMGYEDLGYNGDQAIAFMLKSVHLAQLAVSRYMANNPEIDKPLIAASIGPYGAYLADGSEYHGNYGLSDDQLIRFHKKRIELFDNSEADILAFETIPSFQEARILSDLTMNLKKKAWLSFSCRDGQMINDGTAIADCASLLSEHPTIIALGVNCTAPKYISELITSIKATEIKKKIIVYPNSGEAYNSQSKTWLGTSEPEMFVKMAEEWLSMGTDIIGGCCRIGPDHIRQLNNLLNNEAIA